MKELQITVDAVCFGSLLSICVESKDTKIAKELFSFILNTPNNHEVSGTYKLKF